AGEGRPVLLGGRSAVFRSRAALRRQERRLRRQRRTLRGVLARGDRGDEEGLATGRGPLPRLAVLAGTGAAAHPICERSGGALAAGGPDHTQSRLSGP